MATDTNSDNYVRRLVSNGFETLHLDIYKNGVVHGIYASDIGRGVQIYGLTSFGEEDEEKTVWEAQLNCYGLKVNDDLGIEEAKDKMLKILESSKQDIDVSTLTLENLIANNGFNKIIGVEFYENSGEELDEDDIAYFREMGKNLEIVIIGKRLEYSSTIEIQSRVYKKISAKERFEEGNVDLVFQQSRVLEVPIVQSLFYVEEVERQIRCLNKYF